jgi:hypothetical protein
MYAGAMRWAPADAAADSAPAGLRARRVIRSTAKDSAQITRDHLLELLAAEPENATAAWLLTRWGTSEELRLAAVDYWKGRTKTANAAEVHAILASLAGRGRDIDSMLEHTRASLAANAAPDRAWLLYRGVAGYLYGWASRGMDGGKAEYRKRASRAIAFLEGSAQLPQVGNTDHRIAVTTALVLLYRYRALSATGEARVADHARDVEYYKAYRALREQRDAEDKR